MGPRGLTSATLQERLRAGMRVARRRWVHRAFRRQYVAALAVSIALLALGRIILAASWHWGIVAIVVPFVLTYVGAWARAPSLAEMARICDDRFGLRATLSTAYECSAQQAPRTTEGAAVRGALMRDASVALNQLRLGDLGPPASSRQASIGLAVASFVLLVSYLAPGVFEGPTRLSGPEARTPSLSTQERSAVAEELERLATLVKNEAEYRDDPYLSALSEALRDIADRTLAGELGSSDLVAEVQTLMTHLDAAAPEGRDASAPALERGEDAAGGPGIDASDDGPRWDASDLTEGLAERAEAMQAALDERSSRQTSSFYLDPAVLEEMMREQRSAATVEGEGAGEPAGAAQQSTDAAGDAAGEGTQALAGDETPDEAAFESTDAVELPDGARTGEGARVQALGEAGEPGANGVGGAIGAGEGAGGGGAVAGRAEEGPRDPARDEAGDWRRDPLDPAALAVARALFAPSESPGEP